MIQWIITFALVLGCAAYLATRAAKKSNGGACAQCGDCDGTDRKGCDTVTADFQVVKFHPHRTNSD